MKFDGKYYKIHLSPISQWRTPLNAVTIMGYIMWQIKYNHGEDTLIKILDEFKSNPPFVFSNAFPNGFLPKPASILSIVEKTEHYRSARQLKRIEKKSFVKDEVLFRLLDGEIINRMLDIVSSNEIEAIDSEILTRRKIDREHNVNMFYEFEAFSLNKTESSLVIYAYVRNSEYKKIIFNMLLNLENIGIGASASTGYGRFKITEFSEITEPFDKKTDYVMSLSSFIPNKEDPISIFYDTESLNSKISEQAYRLNTRNPHKKKMIMISSGALMKNPNKPFVGRVVDNIANDKKVCQICYSLLMPIHSSLVEF